MVTLSRADGALWWEASLAVAGQLVHGVNHQVRGSLTSVALLPSRLAEIGPLIQGVCHFPEHALKPRAHHEDLS